MIRTNKTEYAERILIDADALQTTLNCGRHTAERIAAEAGAVVRIGKRKLYSVKKIELYLDSIAGTE